MEMDSVQLSSDGKTLKRVRDKKVTHVVIPDTVIEIAHSAFSECKFLKSVIIPNSVVKIDSWAFHGCI